MVCESAKKATKVFGYERRGRCAGQVCVDCRGGSRVTPYESVSFEDLEEPGDR